MFSTAAYLRAAAEATDPTLRKMLEAAAASSPLAAPRTTSEIDILDRAAIEAFGIYLRATDSAKAAEYAYQAARHFLTARREQHTRTPIMVCPVCRTTAVELPAHYDAPADLDAPVAEGGRP